MASIKVKFRPSTVVGREGTIYYQINNRKVRQLTSEHHLMPQEWNDRLSTVAALPSGGREMHVLSVRDGIYRDLERLNNLDSRLAARKTSYTADDLIFEFRRYVNDYSLFNFIKNISAGLRRQGRLRTSETYMAALSSFRQFRNGEDLIIGTPTGGSTGQPVTIDLGYGYMARICARDEWLPDGNEFIGIGIIPDIVVEETAEIFDGKDVVLDKAIEMLSVKSK